MRNHQPPNFVHIIKNLKLCRREERSSSVYSILFVCMNFFIARMIAIGNRNAHTAKKQKIRISIFIFFPPTGGRSPAGFWAGASSWCTPVMGVNLWGASPLYGNPVTVVRQGQPSTSRRQGRLREEGSGGSWSAKL